MNDDDWKSLEAQDHPKTESYGWIQWKGTDVCMDLHCVCGYFGHIDADFFYYYKCVECGRKYKVGAVVKLIPMTDEQAEGEDFFTDRTDRECAE